MARTKKADQKKNEGEIVGNAAQEQEAQALEAAEQIPEEAVAAAAQMETPDDGNMETDESGKIGENEPESDVFSGLPDPCVYCGPSVRGVARQYTTYQGGIPDALQDFIREHPAALALIIPTERFPAMRKRLETPGAKEAVTYQKVKDELRTGGNGRVV